MHVFYIDRKNKRVEQQLIHEDVNEASSKDSESEDEYFLDTDYELEDGDDDLFQDNVD